MKFSMKQKLKEVMELFCWVFTPEQLDLEVQADVVKGRWKEPLRYLFLPEKLEEEPPQHPSEPSVLWWLFSKESLDDSSPAIETITTNNNGKD